MRGFDLIKKKFFFLVINFHTLVSPNSMEKMKLGSALLNFHVHIPVCFLSVHSI